jgi:hypothetical protein
MHEWAKIGVCTLGLVWMSLLGCAGNADNGTAPQSADDGGTRQSTNDGGTRQSTEDSGAPHVEESFAAPAELKDYNLGLNYNEDVENFNTDDINRIYNADTQLSRWARFIFNITDAYDQREATSDWPAGKNWIAKYCDAHNSGVKTALSIRWEFKNAGQNVPFVNGTCQSQGTCPLYVKYANFLTTQVVPRIKACTDVLVIGNEPFLEALPDDIKPNSNFTRFYKSIAQDALAVWPYKTVPFYFGSFESLWVHNPTNYADEDLAREELLTFVNNESRISGVDLHMHSSTLDQIDKAFEWLNDSNNRLVNGKEIIVTEFSPAPAFRADMDVELSAGFKTKWGALDPNIAATTRNGDYLDYAIKAPRSPDEFQEWISTLPFSAAVPHYVCDAWKRFRSHDGRFRLAFQGATQGIRRPAGYNWKWPWILNPILMPITQKPVNAQSSVRWNWYNDVQKILKNDPSNACP